MNKGLEIVNYLLSQHINENGQHIINDDELKVIETAFKALEVIKNYINVDKDENGLYWINLIGCASIEFTQKEYDLLKEVLL